MKAAGVTKYVGMGSGAMMMPGEKRGDFQRTVHALLSLLKFFGVDMLEQNEWERDNSVRAQGQARPDELFDLRPRRLLPLLRGVERVGHACAACQLRATGYPGRYTVYPTPSTHRTWHERLIMLLAILE
jgi:hypothetical protein